MFGISTLSKYAMPLVLHIYLYKGRVPLAKMKGYPSVTDWPCLVYSEPLPSPRFIRKMCE